MQTRRRARCTPKASERKARRTVPEWNLYPSGTFLPPRARHHPEALPGQEVNVGALVTLGIILIVLWAVLWLGFHIVSGIIHLLIVVGVILIVWGLIKRGARAVDRRI